MGSRSHLMQRARPSHRPSDRSWDGGPAPKGLSPSVIADLDPLTRRLRADTAPAVLAALRRLPGFADTPARLAQRLHALHHTARRAASKRANSASRRDMIGATSSDRR